jgi:hypothetical protein
MAQDDFHERSGGIFVPETVLPSQFFDRVRRRKDLTGEQRLLYAVMEDAVEMYVKHAAARLPLHQRLFDDAEAWIESDERGWVYSFEAICDHLGLDVDYVRAGLRARKARARMEPGPVADGSPVVTDEDAPRRASNE